MPLVKTLLEFRDAMTEGFVLKIMDGKGLMVAAPVRFRGQRLPDVRPVSDDLARDLIAPEWNTTHPDFALAMLTENGEENRTGWRAMGFNGTGDYYLRMQ